MRPPWRRRPPPRAGAPAAHGRQARDTFLLMLCPLDTFTAYREDLAGAPGLAAFGDSDVAWLLLGQTVQRIARQVAEARTRAAKLSKMTRARRGALPDGSPHDGCPTDRSREAIALERLRRDLLRLLVAGDEAGVDREGEVDDTMIAPRVLAVAEHMEAAGALQLAYAVLEAAPRALPAAAPHIAAGALLHRARVARKLGALEAAHDLYEMAIRAARAARDPEVTTRALIGSAVLARRRGNYPASRRLYERALASAHRAALPALIADAHQGLLIAASSAGDVAAALVHGWRAFTFAGDAPAREAEILSNLGAVASVAGEYAAALGAYLGAVARTTEPRVRLPALSGAALSAARLHDREALRAASAEIERELTRSSLPYEHAHSLTVLAEARDVAGEREAARALWRRALEIARAHAFNELVLTSESSLALLDGPPSAASIDVSPDRRPAESHRMPRSRRAVGSTAAHTPNGLASRSGNPPGPSAARAPTFRARAVLRALETLRRDERSALTGVS